MADIVRYWVLYCRCPLWVKSRHLHAQGHCSAMEGLTSALAVELAPVRVNIVSPGVVKTPLWREMTGSARDALYAAEAQRLLVGHVGESQEIAEGYLYLMRQTYVTGQTLAIDGGGLLVWDRIRERQTRCRASLRCYCFLK